MRTRTRIHCMPIALATATMMLAAPVARGEGEPGGGAAATVPQELRTAWSEMLAELERAREAIDDPKLFAPPGTERGLADGYRYLLGHLYGAIERAFHEDTDLPFFRRALQPFNKSTIENADALYLTAPIDGNSMYVVTGQAKSFQHWRGRAPARSGPKAPHYVWFGSITTFTGDSGSLAELRPDVTADTGSLDSSKLHVERDGTFTILLAPEKPNGYSGNFLPTRATRTIPKPDGTTVEVTHTAHYLAARELFYDWEREEALELSIRKLDGATIQPAPPSPASTAERMRRVADITRNQMRFWNEYYAVLLETYQDVNRDGRKFMPENGFNDPVIPSAKFGAAQSTNVYSGGIFDLAPDEALIVEQHIPVPPVYIGFHLGNFWGESTDYANHTSSLNGFQAEPDADGVRRYVIAHRDPGVANWIDTTGLDKGFMSVRWAYSKAPDRLPHATAKKVKLDEVRAHLPADTKTVTPEERGEQIRIRQRHVQRRYRQY